MYITLLSVFLFFFFNDTATTEIYTLSLHDALPILHGGPAAARAILGQDVVYDRLPYFFTDQYDLGIDRKSTRLNSSHLVISYAVFCLKKKKKDILLHGLTRGVVSPSIDRACTNASV